MTSSSVSAQEYAFLLRHVLLFLKCLFVVNKAIMNKKCPSKSHVLKMDYDNTHTSVVTTVIISILFFPQCDQCFTNISLNMV